MRQQKFVHAFLIGSTFLLTKYVADVSRAVQYRRSKKQRKEAIQTWEGEGGAVYSAPRAPSLNIS